MAEPTIDQTDFHFPGQKGLYHGKVRDVYDFGESLLFIATDRYSAFDRNLALIPHKGQLVTAISRWWFDKTSHIIKNHVTGYLDAHATLGKKYKVMPIEMVVRGYITGVTATSLWHNYSQGQRDFGEFTLPDGLQKNQKLSKPVLTPTSKFEEHDRPLTPREAVDEGLIDVKLWNQAKKIALELFTFGQKTAKAKGLILVDTKYEFGTDDKGNLVLIDEIHTPDSSRYWLADSYKTNLAKNEEPDNYDKEYLRLWYKSRFDPYKDKTAPKAPTKIINELSKRYVEVYERLCGKKFKPADRSLAQIEANLTKALGNKS